MEKALKMGIFHGNSTKNGHFCVYFTPSEKETYHVTDQNQVVRITSPIDGAVCKASFFLHLLMHGKKTITLDC